MRQPPTKQSNRKLLSEREEFDRALGALEKRTHRSGDHLSRVREAAAVRLKAPDAATPGAPETNGALGPNFGAASAEVVGGALTPPLAEIRTAGHLKCRETARWLKPS